MRPLKISISGIRGIAGEDLTPDAVRRFARAYGVFLGGGRVVVSTDARRSREDCLRAVSEGLSAAGCLPVSIGISPTPTLQLAIPECGAGGGVCITASHNPPEWNGLKFYGEDGILLDEAAMREVISLFETLPCPAGQASAGAVEDISDRARLHHVHTILSRIDADAVRAGKFKVAVDPVNGAGCTVNDIFFSELGCEVVKINSGVSGDFGRAPEPLPHHLDGLRDAVIESGADIGFAQDPDADRLAVVTDKGECPGEDYTLALAVRHVISKTPGAVVVNLSTSRAVEDVCSSAGVPFFRTKIGERNVIGGMRTHKAVIGGEGNGGVIYPAVNYGRDSFAGMALILQMLADSRKTVGELLAEMPRYYIMKEKVGAEDIIPVDRIRDITMFSDAEIDLTDGVRASWPEGWVHVRGSGTEPVVRVIVEAADRSSAESLYQKLVKAISV